MMSFGASPADIILVVNTARRIYRQCRNAGSEYLEISREVRGLHTVLKHLKFEVEAPDSALNRVDRAKQGEKLGIHTEIEHAYAKDLAPILGDCDFTLRELDSLLIKYGRLNETGNDGRGAQTWDRLRFGNAEMDQLGDIRMKLINHKTSITAFLDTVQLDVSSRQNLVLDNQSGQLDIILDKVDHIAAKLLKADGESVRGSVMTTYDDDDKEVWKQFRRELVAEGFSSDVLKEHKDILRAYIREMDQNGLVETPTSPSPKPESMARQPQTVSQQQKSGVDAQSWLETVRISTLTPTPSVATTAPPSFDSLNTPQESAMGKEMLVSEENMKFSPIMKLERQRPDSAPQSPDSASMSEHDKGEATRQPSKPLPSILSPVSVPRTEPQPLPQSYIPAAVPQTSTSSTLDPSTRPIPRTPSPSLKLTTPKIVTSLNSPISRTKQRLVEDYNPPLTPPTSVLGSTVSTNDLMSPSLSIPQQDRRSRDKSISPSTSPTTARHPSFDSGPRSSRNNLSLAPESSRGVRFDTSPRSSTGALGTSPSTSQYGTSPGDRSRNAGETRGALASGIESDGRRTKLAPDSNGRAIPMDAKWTQINRSLISTEILDRDRRRYEVRPEFVAILGVLTRAEIEDLAERSYTLRASRHRPIPIQPPKKPPRPTPQRQTSSDGDESNVIGDSTGSDTDNGKARRNIHRSHSESYPPNQHGNAASQFRRDNERQADNYTTQPPYSPRPADEAFQPQLSRQDSGRGREFRDRERNRDRDHEPRHSSYVPIPIPVPYQSHSFSSSPQQPSPIFAPQYLPPNPAQYPPQMSGGLGFLAPPPLEEPRRRRSDSGSREDKEKHRTSHGRSSRHGHGHGAGKDGRGGKDARPIDDRVQGKRRWGENLTAAGIGGAAVSLLSVLSEAAENL